jgi:hypothetical protein
MEQKLVSRRNHYRGINPHLQSILQTPAGKDDDPSVWPSFHKDHITHIADFLNEQLPDRYVARTEPSLQIRTDDFREDLPTIRRPKPDVAIYDYGSSQPSESRLGAVRPTPTWDLPLPETLDIEEKLVSAIVIRDLETHRRLGRVVCRIELLSPTNKPGWSGYPLYRRGRLDALHAGTPLIEIDYIHEFPAPIANFPIYPDDADSHAYQILVSDPRPSVDSGRFRAFTFDVDSDFPIVSIPLAATDTLEVNLGVVYTSTYQRGRWGTMIDYAQLPERLETYSAVDQERIRRRMADIAEAAQQGFDLEQEIARQ